MLLSQLLSDKDRRRCSPDGKGADKTLPNKAGRTALESVSGPFNDVKGIYDSLGAAVEPLGLKLDYERIKMTRPQIAEMLR